MIFNSREELAEYDPVARCYCPECGGNIFLKKVRLPEDKFGFWWFCHPCRKSFNIGSSPPVKDLSVLLYEYDQARHDWAEAIMNRSRQDLSRIPLLFVRRSWDLLKTDPGSVFLLAQKVLLPRSYVLEAWDISEESVRIDIQIKVIKHQFLSLDIVFELWPKLSDFDKATLVGQDVFKYIAMDRLPILLTDESNKVQIYAKDLLEQLQRKAHTNKLTSNFIMGPTSYVPV